MFNMELGRKLVDCSYIELYLKCDRNPGSDSKIHR